MTTPDPTRLTLARLLTGSESLHDRPVPFWQALCPQAVRHGLAPLLYHRLAEQGLLETLPEEAQQQLLAAYGQTAGYNTLALEQAGQWASHFAAAGIPAVWFKGVPLSLTVYPRPETRPMTDVDLLVPRAQLPQALALVESLSGRKAAMLNPDHAIHAVFNVGPAGLVKMELHWNLIEVPASRLAPDLDWFLSQPMALETSFGPLLTFRPEAHLLLLCAHAEIAHGEERSQLLRYHDVHALLARTAAFDWQLLVRQAAAFRWTYAVERALALAHDCFATPLPAGLLQELRAIRPADEDVSAITRRRHTRTRWQRTRDRLDALSWRARLHTLFDLLFPAPQYVRWRYKVDRRWKLPFFYLYRWLDAAGDWLRSAGDSRHDAASD